MVKSILTSYMDQTCRELYPGVPPRLAKPLCDIWLEQSIEHCIEFITNSMSLWKRLINWVFRGSRKGTIGSASSPISTTPEWISLDECYSLFEAIVHDSVENDPVKTIHVQLKNKVFSILWLLLGIFAIISSTIWWFYKRRSRKSKLPKKSTSAVAKTKRTSKSQPEPTAVERNLAQMDRDLRKLRVNQVVSAEQLLGPDNTPTLIIPVGPKAEFIRNIVASVPPRARLYTPPEYKDEMTEKILTYLGDDVSVLRVVVVNDEEPEPPFEGQRKSRPSIGSKYSTTTFSQCSSRTHSVSPVKPKPSQSPRAIPTEIAVLPALPAQRPQRIHSGRTIPGSPRIPKNNTTWSTTYKRRF